MKFNTIVGKNCAEQESSAYADTEEKLFNNNNKNKYNKIALTGLATNKCAKKTQSVFSSSFL